jgi:excisionase family DNA binding protein
MDTQLFLVSETARKLGVAASTIRRMHERGELKAVRTPGGVRVFSAEDIAKLVAERKKQR